MDLKAMLDSLPNLNTNDLNFSDPLYQMPSDIEFSEDGFSSLIPLDGSCPDWVRPGDTVLFCLDTDHAVRAEAAADLFAHELAFRVKDRNLSKPKAEPEQGIFVILGFNNNTQQRAMLFILGTSEEQVTKSAQEQGFRVDLALSAEVAIDMCTSMVAGLMMIKGQKP